jgi:hypothetical protein
MLVYQRVLGTTSLSVICTVHSTANPGGWIWQRWQCDLLAFGRVDTYPDWYLATYCYVSVPKILFLHLFPTLSSICASYSFSQNLASFQSRTHKNNKSHFFAAGSSGCDNSTRTQLWVHVWVFESSEHDPWNCTSVYHNNVGSICDYDRFLQ